MSGSPIGLTNSVTAPDPAVHAQLNSMDAINAPLTIATGDAATSNPKIFPTIDSTTHSTFDQPDSWRVEVAARLNRYRTRRKPRAPRYPSLLLPFDASASWLRPAKGELKRTETEETNVAAETDLHILGTSAVTEERNATGTDQGAYRHSDSAADQSNDQANDQSNLIEFPRFAAIPVFHANTLADPIFDRPRIVEAPEILPPPPALGGMLIEAVEKEPIDLRANDSPAATASITRRALAALVDAAILALTMIAMVAIFLRVNPSMNSIRGPLPLLATALGVLTVILWVAYEFLLVVYTGSTPGLRAARLRLATFDGSPLNRRARRWRVLTSLLSAFSAGLGYLWSFLDQNGLCWHDRITRTHVQKAKTDSRRDDFQ